VASLPQPRAASSRVSKANVPALLALGGVLEDLVEVREHCAWVVEQPRRDERVGEELPRDDGGEVRIALAQRGEVLDDRVLGVDLETLLGQYASKDFSMQVSTSTVSITVTAVSITGTAVSITTASRTTHLLTCCLAYLLTDSRTHSLTGLLGQLGRGARLDHGHHLAHARLWPRYTRMYMWPRYTRMYIGMAFA
jgi:hypothetical protein